MKKQGRRVAKFSKRLFDICFSLLVITLLLWWLIPMVSLAICIESKGWPIFRQKRTGLNNRDFWCWKMRSMYLNKEADVLQATYKDSRITKVGRLIRNTNIDELPQFFNALVGDMSVVGPRPHMLKHTEVYTPLVDRYLERHRFRPGITGWAQVNGYHGETTQLWKMKQRVKYDLEYIEHWNFWWDMRIIWKTALCKWILPCHDRQNTEFDNPNIKF